MSRTLKHKFIGLNQRLILLALVLFCSFSAFSQFKNEEELKKQAAHFFEDEDYPAGFKLYSQLVSNYPKDPTYNYRLGVCMLYSEANKKKAIQYLQFAVNHIKDAEKEALFYLGKAYHLNFQFDEAMKYYSQYKQVGSSSMQKKLLVDHEIECCKNGKRLLSNLRELVILDKKLLSQSDYFRSYDLKSIGGKLLAKPADFTSAMDKKKKDRSIIYLAAGKDVLYYASYGEKSDNKDIYEVTKQPSGEWGKAKLLGNEINTPYDEDFPFLHPNGKVLYFASKGHNSMGGFDIFKSEFDEANNTWKQPVNLDFPINSPDDDILFVTDSLEKVAFLASSRQSPAGKIDVYKILTERRPAEYAFIKGTVIRKNPNQNVQSKIKVKNIDNGEDAGTFTADENGEYSIKLSNGGKFIFTVETPGFPTQSEGVNIPTAYNYKPYRQTIEYNDEKLKITNFFETNDGDENNYTQYLKLIEEKTKMEVNAGDFDINPANPLANTNTNPKNIQENNPQSVTTTTTSAVTPSNTNPTSTTPTKTNLNNNELVKMANEDAKELQQSADSLKQDAATAFSAANSKQDQANEKKQEATELQNKANAETDPAKKQELLAQAEKVKDEADLFSAQATTANNIAKQMEVDARNKQKEADLNTQYAKALEEADKTKNNKQAIAKLEELQKQLEEASKQKSGTDNLVESIKVDAQNKEQELKNAEDKQKKIDDILDELGKQMEDLNAQEKDTKDKGLLDNIKGQKEEIANDIAEKQKESTLNKTKIATLKDEADALRSQADYASNIQSGTPTNTVTTSVATNTTATTNTVAITNTVAATNTVNTTAENTTQPSAFEKESKKLDGELAALNDAGNDLDNNKKKADVLTQYVSATDRELKDKKEALKKAKTASEKTALNKDIKQLENKRSSIEKEKLAVADKIKEQEKQSSVATNTTVSTNTATTAGTNTTTVASNTVATTNTVAAVNNNPVATESNSVGPTNTNTTTVAEISNNQVPDTANLAATNPKLAAVNDLLAQTKTETEKQRKLYEAAGYTDPKAAELKKQADEKFAVSRKNQIQLEQQLKDLQAQLAKDGGNNPTAEKQVSEIKSKLSKEKQIDNTALKLLADAGKAEYNASLIKYNAEEKKTGSNYDAQELLAKGATMYKNANLDLSNLISAKGDDQKQNLYLSANEKLEDAVSLVKKATTALSIPDTAVATNTIEPSNTNTVSAVNTNTLQPVNTNTVVAEADNTVTPANTNTVEPVNTNTTTVASNTVTPVNSNTVAPVNTNTIATTNTITAVNTNTVAATNTNTVATTNTVTPANTGALTETQLQEIKNTPEYQKVTSFKNTINKYNESANVDAEKSQEENLKAAQLTKEAEAMPAGPERQKKEQEAAATKQKADSLQEMANNTRALAQSKKQELEDYSANLDKATTDKIAAASLQTTVGTPPATNQEYSAAYTEKTKQLDSQLSDLKNQTTSPDNLKKQNEVITAYISDIDNEVTLKKKQQAAAGSQEEKNSIAAQIKNLQLKKINFTNERASNENSLRSQAGTNVAANNNASTNNTLSNNTPSNNTPVTNTVSTNTPANSTEKYLTTGGFEIKKDNAYSQKNPIPVDEKLPDGLYFRVQIGAFKNPIPQDRFSGLAPIGAETTPAGFVRYQVGLFNKYQAAVAVKNDMRKLKYNDAFVVAYRNGKRISLAEALDTLRKSGEDIVPNANSTAGITVNSNIPVNPEATPNVVTNPVKVDNDLNTLNGIFYTIQIGVYGNNVSASGLLNLNPVFKEALPTGYNRYTAGIYSDYEKVKADRARVNSLGIPDAFVSGYLNGKRVTVNEPLDEFAGTATFLQQRPIIFPDANQVQPANNTPATNTTVATNVQPFSNGVTEGPAPTETNGVKTNDDGITFKVQIGAFRNQVPQEVANNWLKVKTWPVKYTIINDLYVYTVGSFTQASFAKNLKNEIVGLGITDAFVTVFKDGKKLYGAEATQYLNR